MPQTLTIKRPLFRCFLLSCLLATLLSMLATVSAEAADLPGSISSPTSDETVVADQLDSPEAVQSMVSRLSDKEVRELLLQRLEAQAIERQTDTSTEVPAGVVGFFTSWAQGVYLSTSLAIKATPNMYSAQKDIVNRFVSNQGETGVLHAFTILALAVVLGLIAERIVIWFTRKWRDRIANPVDPDSYRESLRLLGLRFVLDMIGLVTFITVTAIFIETVQTGTSDDFSFLVLNNLIFLPRLMLAFTRFLLAPTHPELRIVHCNDETARFLHRQLFGFALLIGLSEAWLAFNRMNGAGGGEIRIGYWLSLSRHLYVIYIVWHARSGLTEMMSGWDQAGKRLSNTIARMYPGFLIVMSVFLWLVVEKIVSLNAFGLLKYRPHTFTLLLLLFIPVFDTIIRTAVSYMLPPMSGSGEVATKAYLSTKSSFIRIGRVLLFGAALFILSFIWQIRPHDLAARGVGQNVATDTYGFLVILSIGYLVWEVVTLWINRKLAAEQTAVGIDLNSEEPGGGEGGGAGASRLSTILPLMRFSLQTVIVIMTVLIAFSNVGINITPLLAGAGVVGIAVGFGAQKLVQDIFSGIFFLVDDAFRAGEYISIEGTLGSVEQISLRSMQLRHHRGAVHTIPYSEIPKLTNYSRDWVVMKLKFTVPFDTDLQKVKMIFKQIGKEMMQIEEFKGDFLQPFKSQGVLEVNDVGIVMRGKFMAKPGTQFMIRKELYNRVQKAFEENGLQFARKEVRVKLDSEGTEDLSAAQKTVIAGAAAEAAQLEVEQQQPKGDQPGS